MDKLMRILLLFENWAYAKPTLHLGVTARSPKLHLLPNQERIQMLKI